MRPLAGQPERLHPCMQAGTLLAVPRGPPFIPCALAPVAGRALALALCASLCLTAAAQNRAPAPPAGPLTFNPASIDSFNGSCWLLVLSYLVRPGRRPPPPLALVIRDVAGVAALPAVGGPLAGAASAAALFMRPGLPAPRTIPLVQHQGTTSPDVRTRTLADGFPTHATGGLGTDGTLDPASWGHMSQTVRRRPDEREGAQQASRNAALCSADGRLPMLPSPAPERPPAAAVDCRPWPR